MKPIRYYLAEDTIDQRDIRELIRWLQSAPRLTKGKLTVEFERQWSQRLNRKYSVFCNSGSSANLLMYYALLTCGALRNKKVIVPSVGWVTSIAPAIQFGFEPVMCEADPMTFGLDIEHLSTLLKKYKPSSVMLVQVLGVPHLMREMRALQKKYNFFLLEDACASIGSTDGGKQVGSFGDMSSFSFYFGHQMSTIEGGMVSTDNKKLYDQLLMLRSHGWSKDLDRSSHNKLINAYHVDDFHSPFVFYEPGFNLRSTDLNAKLGLSQLKKLDWMIKRRHENHMRYCLNLEGFVRFQQWSDSKSIVSSISFGALAKNTGERKRIVRALEKHGIETRIFSAGNLGLHPFWYNRYGKASFPVADAVHYRGFFLPNHPSLSLKQVDFISQVVIDAL